MEEHLRVRSRCKSFERVRSARHLRRKDLRAAIFYGWIDYVLCYIGVVFDATALQGMGRLLESKVRALLRSWRASSELNYKSKVKFYKVWFFSQINAELIVYGRSCKVDVY